MPSARNHHIADIQTIFNAHTDVWGIKVRNVKNKPAELDESKIRAIAK